ncbi:(d)CMP kinase [Scatolibacter rhodanostii]|uniref:(d)CMP kinase n=1 Tax=Scatolibacter rhodanostii TaxID=2014781 RepID=UPI000C0714D9|nr:(d)CMP kinase [Scatolibacter rhodanostii]
MFAVAIDGPSGAGKSSVARAVAEELGFIYVDTGAIYRTVAVALMQLAINVYDEEQIESALTKIQVNIERVDGEQRMFLGNRDVTELLRTPEITKTASVVAAVPTVRDFLLEIQRKIAQENHVIMDGRDIGTVVLPHAQIKIFLTASAEERAKRRIAQMEEAGMKPDPAAVLSDIRERDERDSNREIAPLRPAEDSILVDTSSSTKEETVQKMISIIKEKRENAKD